MTGRKSQEELEQPAKVYQLDSVEGKVDQALAKLDALTQSVQGVVTPIQLESAIKELRSDYDKKLEDLEEVVKTYTDSEVKSIHLKYNPTYKGIWWVVTSIAGLLIASVWASINNFWRGS